MRHSKFLVTMVSSLSLLCLLSSCGDPLQSFLSEVDQANYSKAQTIYAEKIYGNTEKENLAYDELLNRLNSAIEDYNAEVISDTEARNIIETISRLEIMDSKAITDYLFSLTAVAASKSAFSSAEVLFDKGQYLDAYSQYTKVHPNDINYESAMEKAHSASEFYIDEVFTAVDSNCNDHKYDTAITNLQNAIDHLDTSERLLTKANIVKREYSQYAIDSAHEIFTQNSSYQDAWNIVHTAWLNMGQPADLPQLTEAMDYYASFKPVELLNLDYYTRSGIKPSDWLSTDKDNMGNNYTYGKKYSWWTKSDSEQTYLLNGKYDRLTGIYVCHYDSRNVRSQADNIDSFHSELRIYGDGRLLYSSPNMGYKVSPASFDLNINGVNELSIQLKLFSASMADLQSGLVDVYIQKTPPQS